jgi:hypothetical protein
VLPTPPVSGSDLARRAAELVECCEDPETFWAAQVKLMTRSERGSTTCVPSPPTSGSARQSSTHGSRGRGSVQGDKRSARASGLMLTPSFSIDGRRYDGPLPLVADFAARSRPDAATSLGGGTANACGVRPRGLQVCSVSPARRRP